MKNIICFFAALAASVTVLADASPIYFRGVLKLGASQQFSLATEGGAKTDWVEIGDSFNGYNVTSFDSASNVLVLESADGEELRLGLAGASAGEAAIETGPALEEAAELLRSMKFEEMMETSIEQQKEMMEKMMRQMAEQFGAPVDDEMIAQQMRFMEAFHEELDWEGMQADMIQAYGEVFTREELQGLIDFYSTPAGQGFIEKQDELMQRTTELIQPRIMKAMSKLQTMIQEMEALQPTEAPPVEPTP